MKFDLIEKIKKTNIRYKLTFLSVMIFGLFSQGMGMFNKYSYSDDIGGGFSTLGASITSGRWMLEVFSRIETFIFGDGHYSLPLFNGVVSIIYISIAACLIVSLLDIKNNLLCICVGGIMVVFPTITGIFGYIFTAPSYMLSMLVGVYGTSLICKNNSLLKTIIGILLITCSVGVYQAFIPVILSLFVFYLIKLCSEQNIEIKTIYTKIAKAVASIVVSIVLYFVINKIVLSICNQELTSYLGIDTMGKSSIGDYLYRILFAYGRFFILDQSKEYYVFYSNIKYVYYALMAIAFVLMIIMFKKIFNVDKAKSFILLLLFAAVPLASNFIFVMVDASNVHALMVYGQLMPFILLIWMLDNVDVDVQFVKYISIVATALLLLMNVMFCRFDNQCYLEAEYVQQETISYFTTLVTRIKSTENYDDELPVSFVFIDGSRIEDKSIYEIEHLNYINVNPYDDMYYYVNNYEWKNFMKRWCGYNPEIVDGSDLVNNKEVLDMPCYPDYGSIKVVDNRVVVRFR